MPKLSFRIQMNLLLALILCIFIWYLALYRFVSCVDSSSRFAVY